MGCPIARVGDSIGHGTVTLCVFTGTITGTITGPGQPNLQSPVGTNVAKIGDTVVCSTHPATIPNLITSGSTSVKTTLGTLGVARIGDTTTCGAKVATGNPTVLVGG